MKQTFKIGLLILILGVSPLYLYVIGIKLGLFKEGLEMILGMLAWVSFPTAIIIFIIGMIQYFKSKTKK
jgi:hypothetical protein